MNINEQGIIVEPSHAERAAASPRRETQRGDCDACAARDSVVTRVHNTGITEVWVCVAYKDCILRFTNT